MKKIKVLLPLSIFFLFTINVAVSQPDGGGPGSGDDPDVPITGVEILIVVGGLLGFRKLANIKRKSE